MNAAKIHFSAEESTLLQDPSWLLTKNRLIAKLYELLGQEAHRLQACRSLLPEAVTAQPPKISRGENYQDLPWVMLDYPRLFSATDIFALRTFFWWGRFWNITLHLKGDYIRYPAEWAADRWLAFEALGGRCCYDGEEWKHEWYEQDGVSSQVYREEKAKPNASLPFLKLGVNLPLTEPEKWPEQLEAVYTVLLGGMPDQLPRR